jgi:membrane protein YqaA with SNARE-associated domain
VAWVLFPLGLLDNSIIPLPGSMDVLTIFLSARNEQLWLYYALMATAGSVAGGFVNYRLAREGGKETRARRFSRKTLDKVYKRFERWGLGAIAIPAMLPPPVPMLPFLFGARAMQYPVRKFLLALTLGRMIRYTLLALLAARYGATDTCLHCATRTSGPIHWGRADCYRGGHTLRYLCG